MASYDAIVVGAGPAGAATAAHLARGGARVLLCDRSHFPRDKACGGGLTPRGVSALQRLGIDLGEGAVRVGGLEMSAAGRSVVTAFPTTSAWPSHGLVARRSVLDDAIVRAAVEAGAELRTGVRVAGPVHEDGTCRGVRLRPDGPHGTTEEIEASWTIAADGATSVIARAAGLAPQSTSAPTGFWYTALRGFVGPVRPRTLDGSAVLEFYPLRTASGRWLPAYGWVFPLPGGGANVGVDIPHSPRHAATPALRAAYDAFLDRMRREREGFADAVEEAPPQGALLPEAMAGFRPAAPGLLAVGDAAGLITPYSGEGILYALESAELAAGALLSGSAPSEVVRRYTAAIDDGYRFQLSSALAIMKAMRKAPLARAAAAVGLRSERALRAGVRVMAYLIEDGTDGDSTVSKGYRIARRIARSRSSGGRA